MSECSTSELRPAQDWIGYKVLRAHSEQAVIAHVCCGVSSGLGQSFRPRQISYTKKV